MIYMINVYGDCDCDLSALDPNKYVLNVISEDQAAAGNSNTGANSSNDATITDNQSATVEQNNTANVNNNIHITANTGGNQANNNTGTGTVKSGSVNIMTNLVNLLNAKVQSGQRLALNILNIFGKWKGKAAIASSQPATPSSAGSTSSSSNNSSASSNNTTSVPFFSAPAPVVTTAAQQVSAPVVKRLARATRGSSNSSSTSTNTSSNSGNSQTTLTGNLNNGSLSGNSSTNGSSTTTTYTSNDGTTTTTSTGGTPRGGIRGWLDRSIAVAHAAATKNGLIGSESSPAIKVLAVPVALWIFAEIAFTIMGRRQKKKVVVS
jgi:hypothetical protein